MNIKFELFTKYLKEPNLKIYKHKIKSLLKLNEIYVLSNISEGALIVPVKETNWGIVQCFETLEIANQYISENRLQGYVKVDALSINTLLLMLEKLFYKGVTGILYNCLINTPQTIYIPMPFLFNDIEDTLVTTENGSVIKLLIKALYTNEYLNYLHHPSLTVDEVSIGIVRYVLRHDGKNNYIDLFETRDIAESYCKKKYIEKKAEDNYRKIIKDNKDNKEVLNEIEDDVMKEKYPVTTIMNSVLFHSIKLLLEKEQTEKENFLKEINEKKSNNTDYELTKEEEKIMEMAVNKKSNLKVKLHSKTKIYNINMDDFLRLVINTGFEQLDLS